MRALAASVIFTAALSACAGRRAASPLDAQRVQAEDLAVAAAVQQAQAKTQDADYRLGGADLLEIAVFGEKDLDRKVRVSQDGTITFPLAGSVHVGGLTTANAEAALAKRLSAYLRDPQVSIFIKEYGNKKVFVFGQVAKPGAIELPEETPLTVLGAVSQAQGFTPIAAPDRTRVIRMVDGKSQTFVIVVSDITQRGQKDKDMVLKPNDIVYVPESMF